MKFCNVPRILSVLLALAGGLTLDLAFPNVGLWFLAFFAIAMLAIAISRNAPGWNFLLGFLARRGRAAARLAAEKAAAARVEPAAASA